MSGGMGMTQRERIEYYESLLDRVTAAIEALEAAKEDFLSVQPQAEELAAYYASGDWRRDYEDDEAGRLPEGLKRGVLSQDLLYDLLEENDRLLRLIRQET